VAVTAHETLLVAPAALVAVVQLAQMLADQEIPRTLLHLKETTVERLVVTALAVAVARLQLVLLEPL
jgi:hypothetical protein